MKDSETTELAAKIWNELSQKLRDDTTWKETGQPHNFDYVRLIERLIEADKARGDCLQPGDRVKAPDCDKVLTITMIVHEVPGEAIARFAEGGFWRLSQLARAE